MKPGFVDTPTVITEALSVTTSLKGQGPEEYQSQAFQGYEHRGSQKIFDVLSGRWAKKTLPCYCLQQSLVLGKLSGCQLWSHLAYLIFVSTPSWWEWFMSSLMLNESDSESAFLWKRTFFERGKLTVCWEHNHWYQIHFSSVAQSCLTLYDPMDCSTPGLPVHPRAYSNSCPSSRWYHPTISSAVVPFSRKTEFNKCIIGLPWKSSG